MSHVRLITINNSCKKFDRVLQSCLILWKVFNRMKSAMICWNSDNRFHEYRTRNYFTRRRMMHNISFWGIYMCEKVSLQILSKIKCTKTSFQKTFDSAILLGELCEAILAASLSSREGREWWNLWREERKAGMWGWRIGEAHQLHQ